MFFRLDNLPGIINLSLADHSMTSSPRFFFLMRLKKKNLSIMVATATNEQRIMGIIIHPPFTSMCHILFSSFSKRSRSPAQSLYERKAYRQDSPRCNRLSVSPGWKKRRFLQCLQRGIGKGFIRCLNDLSFGQPSRRVDNYRKDNLSSSFFF